MLDRAFLLSHPRFYRNNLVLIINILLSNHYPLEIIFNIMNKRLKYLLSKQKNKINKKDNSNDNKNSNRWITISFILSISYKFKNITKKLNVNLSYFRLNKFEYIIKGHKDTLSNLFQKNVVYKLSCKDCDTTYVGRTGKKLKTRINDHNQKSYTQEHKHRISNH